MIRAIYSLIDQHPKPAGKSPERKSVGYDRNVSAHPLANSKICNPAVSLQARCAVPTTVALSQSCRLPN